MGTSCGCASSRAEPSRLDVEVMRGRLRRPSSETKVRVVPREGALFARLLRIAFVLALAVFAVVLGALSLVEYEVLRDHVDSLSVDRDADVTAGEFDRLVWRLRAFAVALGASACLLVRFGETLDRRSSAVLVQWWSALRASPGALQAWARSESSATLGALAIVLVTGVVLRIASLDVPMRYDEAATYNGFVGKPLYIGLANYSVPNNHLFHTLLANISVTTFGNHPWSLRLPAFLAGVALIPLAFAFARHVYGRTAALITAALVATSSTLVEYSTNARGYTLVAVFTLGALLAAARVIDTGSLGAWAAVGVCGVLGLYTVPTMLYALGGVFVWITASLLARGRPVRDVARAVGGCVAFVIAGTALLYVPVFAASGVGSVTSNDVVAPLDVASFVGELPAHVRATLDTWGRDLPLGVSLALLIGVVGSVALGRRASRYGLPPLLAMFVWIVPLLALQRVVPFTRVWLFLVPVAFATSAGFYGWLLDRTRIGYRLGEIAAVAVAAIGSWLLISNDSVSRSTETGALPDGVAIAEYLERTLRPGDSVLAVGSDAILQYYLERDGYEGVSAIWSNPGRRVVVVVNRVRGDQTLEGVLGELPAGLELRRPVLLRSWPRARVYLVRTA